MSIVSYSNYALLITKTVLRARLRTFHDTRTSSVNGSPFIEPYKTLTIKISK